jgi:endonuclease/exonuclease/phosphatase family metal-dependent hydrolase
MTYNIHHAENASGQIDPGGVARVIKAIKPDFVALQEVDSATGRSKGIDEAVEIARLSGMPYVYFSRSMPFDGGSYGNAVLSRFPLIQPITHSLISLTGEEARSAAEVTVALKGGEKLSFSSTHLDYRGDNRDRLQQADSLLAWYGERLMPVLLAGDLNATPDKPEIHKLLSVFRDLSARSGPTFPNQNPTEKIDFVLGRPGSRWRVKKVSVRQGLPASDHCPVVVTLVLRP